MKHSIEAILKERPELANDKKGLMREYLKRQGCELLLAISIVEKFDELKEIDNFKTFPDSMWANNYTNPSEGKSGLNVTRENILWRIYLIN